MGDLTERVLAYQRSRRGLDGLVAEIAPYVLRYPRRRFGWDEDACGEFYLFVHPRLVRALGRFRDQGKPFEAYLASVLHWQARSFARRLRRDEQAWALGPRLAAACGGATGEGADAEAIASPPLVSPGGAAADLRAADRRHLLFLVLKCCRRLGPGGIAAAAAATGVDPVRLAALVERLQASLEPAERRLEMLRERRNRAFSEARRLEADLERLPDAEAADRLRHRLEAARRRMRAAMARMSRVRRDPTNREVARVLGVPKGTVDCGLFLLKRRLSPSYDPERERSA